MEVLDFPRARKPSYRVKINFGEKLEAKKSSLQAKTDPAREEMLGRYGVCVVNFPPKNIAGFLSEVLVPGVPHKDGGLSLLEPGRTFGPSGGKGLLKKWGPPKGEHLPFCSCNV